MLLSAVCIHAKAQTISAGYGFFDTNQEVFKKGQKFEFEAGNRLSKIVLCNLYYSHGIVPEIKNFYPMFIIYSFDSPTIDTFYNVHEVNKYKMETFLFKARFYTNPSNKLSIFITPLVGFTKLSETITLSDNDIA